MTSVYEARQDTSPDKAILLTCVLLAFQSEITTTWTWNFNYENASGSKKWLHAKRWIPIAVKHGGEHRDREHLKWVKA